MNPILNNILETFNTYLNTSIPKSKMETSLEESMRYSLEAGGKRIRPLLLLATLDMLSEEGYQKGMSSALALEMIHTYSLIHDDLPAMDNDDYRRGKPTNHKVYGEWMAILAGDALLTKAFELIATQNDLKPNIQIQLIQSLAQASGHLGMVGGQTLDMQSESQQLTLSQIQTIHEHKTGALIHFAIVAAAIIAEAPPRITQLLSDFAKQLGVIFQIKDDLLDVYGDQEKLGKPVGSDILNDKSTYVTLLGKTEAEHQLNSHIQQAEDILNTLASEYDVSHLNELLKLFYQRQN
ncbi:MULTISPECIES: polyprenyl synthetase family protein [Staphylococcus]|uniref:Farnesyl diphosphate synthase n=1 Tax=Staphylococcus agnetis TaxID=985762 RepID=A0ABD7TX03_9STAP|nr:MULTISPECIES: farnesyl diphosphate synthase [Staphylococcus]MBY7663595.1 polyprenyl synthetase family protein [Staphylococcus agnetis]MCO4326699.1 polyprenyl synthetase family protein [Staphylococcus agnetis]MCO4357590.1 polyprenyl synthetase family protein [Staphylococcus agnetis]MCO4362204.1 polyprenyl synthetase family protein [Staphylococcus agnetis]MCO4369563.1 polyprenyl synthetase family protein [Staphylococcus agnetis]